MDGKDLNAKKTPFTKEFLRSLSIAALVLAIIGGSIAIGVAWGESKNGSSITKLEREKQSLQDSIIRCLVKYSALNRRVNSNPRSLQNVVNEKIDSLDKVIESLRSEIVRKNNGGEGGVKSGSRSDFKDLETLKVEDQKTTTSRSVPRETFVPPNLDQGYVKLASYDISKKEFFGVAIDEVSELTLNFIENLNGNCQLKPGALIYAKKPENVRDEFLASHNKVEIIESNTVVLLKSKVYKIEENGIIQFWVQVSKS